MSPPEREDPGSSSETGTDHSSNHQNANHIQSRRRDSVRRMVGGDPWRYPPPGERGYPEAAEYLLELDLLPAPNVPAMRSMWRCGGHSRRTAQLISEAWGLAS
jgi:hypothetical protein